MATVDRIMAAPPRSREIVERIFGQALTQRQPPSSFEFWGSSDIALSDSIVSLEFVEWPRSTQLVVSIRGICFTKEQVRERFPEFPRFVPGSTHALLQTFTWVYPQSWGEIGFGFPGGEEACLEQIVVVALKD